VRNCTHRKSEYRIHEVLPNGQHLNLFFKRRKPVDPDYPFFQWKVGLCISSSRKEANKWWNGKDLRLEGKQTGNCGLTGLRLAVKYILEFVHTLKQNEEVIIDWADEKRMRVYKYLYRLGFTDFVSEDGRYENFGMRNPNIWEWVEAEKEQNDTSCEEDKTCMVVWQEKQPP
jgi:hypothetical protein